MNNTITIHEVTVNVPSHLSKVVSEITTKNGKFYKSKPKNASGDSKYIWRMIAFYSGIRPEMPMTAEFDLDDVYWEQPLASKDLVRELRRIHVKELDSIVTEILNLFKGSVEYGTLRWGRALGQL